MKNLHRCHCQQKLNKYPEGQKHIHTTPYKHTTQTDKYVVSPLHKHRFTHMHTKNIHIHMPIFECILSIHNVHESYTRICMDTCIHALLLQHIASHKTHK